MRATSAKATLLLLLVIFGNSAQANNHKSPFEAEANAAFVKAMMDYKIAQQQSGGSNKAGTAQLLKKLEFLQRTYTGTRIASRIATGSLGSLSIDALKLVIKGNQSPTPEIVALVAKEPSATEVTRRLSSGNQGYETLLQFYRGKNDQLKEVADSADYAVLAWAAYESPAALSAAAILGWTPFKSVFDPNLFGGDTFGTIFVSDNGQHVLAFRGSVGKPYQGDWRTNLIGTFDPTPLTNGQIEGARKLARSYASQFPGLIFVGHSLGGRLAQVARIETGRTAVIFNSAPLGISDYIKKVPNFGVSKAKLSAFRSPKDPLTSLYVSKHLVVKNNTEANQHSMSQLALAMQDVKQALFKKNNRKATQEKVSKQAIGGAKPDGGMVFNYRMAEVKKVKVSGKQCHIYAPWETPTDVRWTGSCSGGVPSGEGRIIWMQKDRVVWVDEVGDQHGLVFRQGRLFVHKDLSNFEVTFEECKDNTYYRFAVVIAPENTKVELFNNHWLTKEIGRRTAMMAAERCPKPSPDTYGKPAKYLHAGFVIKIGKDAKQSIVVGDADRGTEFKWRVYQHYMQSAMNDKITKVGSQIRNERWQKEQARQQKLALQRQQAQARKIEAARKLEIKRVANINKLYSAKEAEWTAHWNSQFASGAPWPNVADLLRLNKGQAIAKLAKGHSIQFQYEDSKFVGGQAFLLDAQPLTNIFQGLPPLQSGMDAFFTGLAQADDLKGYTIYCKVPASLLGSLTVGSTYTMHATLLNVGGSGGFLFGRVDVECELT